MKKHIDDWIVHVVYDSKDSSKPIDIHTHGLEKHGIPNLCMECPTMDLAKFCGGFINLLAEDMINGEKYNVGEGHIMDNLYLDEPYGVLHVFDLYDSILDNGEGLEYVLVVNYWFDRELVNPVDGLRYRFDKDMKEWMVSERADKEFRRTARRRRL